MGANLIAWIFVGPKKIKLSPQRTDVLVKQVAENIEAKIGKAEKALAKTHQTDVEKLRCNPCYTDWLFERLEEEEDGLGEVLPELVKDSSAVRAFIGEFVEFWNEAETRDSTYRYFGSGRDMLKIVVAGDMSWGDEPDGVGYQLMKRATLLGLLEPLGIE